MSAAPSADGIRVEGLTKTFRRGRVRALDGVSLAISPGEAFGLIGPNGAGKTTFLGCLLGFVRPDAGRVTVEGLAPDSLEIRAATGYLPERLVYDRWMRGRDFLRYHHALARRPRAEREHDVDTALARVGLDAGATARSISRYSRGMLQRLGLAQALLGRPRYLFLDEPASGVDPAGVLLIRRVLAEVKAAGTTVLLNSHQLEQVERICDRVAFLRAGTVEAIEVLSAGADRSRVLRVRAASGTAWPPPERLAELAAATGAGLAGAREGDARFTVTDDGVAARLIAALVAAGVPVIEATPEESRLERLFEDRHAGVRVPGTPP